MKKIFLLLIGFWCIMTTINAQVYYDTDVFGSSWFDNVVDVEEYNGKFYSCGLYGGAISFGTDAISHNGGNADAFLAQYNSNGSPSWFKQFAATSQDEAASAVAIDHSGNIYLTGYFKGINFDADPGPSTDFLSQPSLFLSRDCFIIKLDDDGDFVWAKQISNSIGGGNEDATDIEVDLEGNVYVAGNFSIADFDPGSGVETMTGSGESIDGFVLKLDNDGDFVWAKQFGGSDNDKVNDIEIDSVGNVYVAGAFEGTADLDPSSTALNYTSSGESDIFVAKLDSLGDLTWVKTVGGTGNDIPYALEITKEGIYYGGFFEETVDFDPSNSTASSISAGSWDAFVSKLDTAGNYEWKKTFGDSGIDQVKDIDIGDGGDVYAIGTYYETIDFTAGISATSNGDADFFVLKMDASSGAYANHASLGGTGIESGGAISVNDAGIITIVGAYRNTVDFNPFEGIDNESSSGQIDAFFTQFAFAIPDNPYVALTSNAITVQELDQTISIEANILYGNENSTSVSMSFDAMNSTADAADFSLGTSTQTSLANMTSNTLTFEVMITDDMIEEDNETIVINLGNLTNNASFLGDSTFTITILENDIVIDSTLYDIVINEIMYNPPGTQDSEEYIELYNNSGVDVELEGYTFTEGIAHVFGEVTIAAGEYLIVAKNKTSFENAFGGTAVKWNSGILTNGGETIVLKNHIGVTVDSVVYDNDNGWPIDASGNGNSLILCDPNLDNSAVNSWSASENDLGILLFGNSVYASPNAMNSCPPPPSIYSIVDLTTVNANGVVDSLSINCGVEGVVYGTNLNEFGIVEFTIIDDANNGLRILGYWPDYTVTEGDSLRVYGTVLQVNGLTQMSLDSIIYINSDNGLVYPDVVSSLEESIESSLIKIEGLSLVDLNTWPSSGTDAYAVLATNGTDTYTIRIDKETDIDEMMAPSASFDITGLGYQDDNTNPFDDGYSIAPRYWADFDVDTIPQIEFLMTNTSVNEDGISIDIDVEIVDGNSMPTMVDVEIMSSSTATANTDFSLSSQTVNVNGGIDSSTVSITVTIIDDMLYEGLETIQLKLVNPTNNAAIGEDSILTINIIENEINGEGIVINEIMYGDSDIQFVELLNNSDATVNLDGFYFMNEDLTHHFTNEMISANLSYVLLSNESVGGGLYGIFGTQADAMNLSASSSLMLYNNDSILIDEVTYTASSPWPVIDFETKIQSIILCDVDTDNADATHWSVSNENQNADILYNGTNVNASPHESNDCSLVGIGNIDSDQVLIYPNPFNNFIKIETEIDFKNLLISNALGQIIRNEPFEKTVDVSNLPNGIFYMECRTENGDYLIYKMVKE